MIGTTDDSVHLRNGPIRKVAERFHGTGIQNRSLLFAWYGRITHAGFQRQLKYQVIVSILLKFINTILRARIDGLIELARYNLILSPITNSVC